MNVLNCYYGTYGNVYKVANLVAEGVRLMERNRLRRERSDAPMYETSVYSIAPYLWRWEIRCGGALLRCGTAATKAAAEIHINAVVNT
jgi:hypothetical protein